MWSRRFVEGIKYHRHIGYSMREATHTDEEDERENFTTYHVRQAVAVHTQFSDDDLHISDYYNHTYIHGPKAQAFVDKFCGDKPGDFSAKLKKSPLLDEADHYHFAIK